MISLMETDEEMRKDKQSYFKRTENSLVELLVRPRLVAIEERAELGYSHGGVLVSIQAIDELVHCISA